MRGMGAFIEQSSRDGQVTLKGQWTVDTVDPLLRELDGFSPGRTDSLRIDGAALEGLDTTGAALLLRKMQALHDAGIRIHFDGLDERHRQLLRRLEEIRPTGANKPDHTHPVDQLAGKLRGVWSGILDFLSFTGHVCVSFGRLLLNPSRLRFASLTRHIHEAGLNAIPIVSLIAFLIAIVVSYQGATQLQRFGADIFTIDLAAISILREMAVLLTAIMVAGRSGSAFAAELGVMKINQEVDALRTTGVDPVEILVLPRLLALLIALPLLAVIAALMGLVGTAILTSTLLNIPIEQFLQRLETVPVRHFWVGISKAPVFALLIATSSCLRGMQVSQSAEKVGTHTTTAVVESIFLVILADALFSIFFSEMGW